MWPNKRSRPLQLLLLALAGLTAPYWLFQARLLASCSSSCTAVSSLVFYITGAGRQLEPPEPRLLDCFNDTRQLLSFFYHGFDTQLQGTYVILKQPVDVATTEAEASLSPGCVVALSSGKSAADSAVTTDSPEAPSLGSCFNWSLSDAEQAQAYPVLHQLHQNFSQRGLELILADGSLMGSVRHFGFIPWDDDVDFLIRRDQRAEVWQLLVDLSAGDQFEFVDTESVNQHWRLGIMCSADRSHRLRQLYGTGLDYPVKSCRVAVDLFFGDTAGRYYLRPERPYEFPFNHIYPLTMRPFGPYLMPGPSDAEAFLSAQYGPGYLSGCRFYTHSDSQFRCKRPHLPCSELRPRHHFVSRLKLQLPSSAKQQQQQEARSMDVDVLVAWKSQLVAIYIPRQ